MTSFNKSDCIKQELSRCRLCAAEFQHTKTKHDPRPIVWFDQTARILIAGQAPGLRVHESGVPFDDRSGDRLRDWLGLNRSEFYNQSKIAIVPMGFCFPGYTAAGHDLPPPKRCAQTWRDGVLASLPNIQVTVLIGAYAQAWHLKSKMSLSDRIAQWQSYLPETFVTPHPSWRNNAWLKKNPIFEAEVLPVLKQRIRDVYDD